MRKLETVVCPCGYVFDYERSTPGRPRRWCDYCLKLPTSRRHPAHPVVCSCGQKFSTSTDHLSCRQCRYNRLCEGCGVMFKREKSQRFCSYACAYHAGANLGDRLPYSAARERARLQEKGRRRRAQMAGSRTGPYTTQEIAELDRFICQWWECGKPVDMTLSGRDPWGPTIDHTIPLAWGGPDVRENVTLMHRRCNSIKGSRMPV